ncbi:hypothetical protein V8D89_009841 [Ganoderma adspersum]
MQFLALFTATLGAFATSAVAAPSPCNCPGPVTSPADPPKPENTTVRVGYTLDLNPDTPLGSLSCSATFAKNFPKFHKLGQLPTAPFYGEVPGAVDGSPKCGSCWQLQYNGQPPVYMVAVDNAAMIQLGKQAFDKFAGAAGVAEGSVDATAVEVERTLCGL